MINLNKLQEQLKIAEMNYKAQTYLILCTVPAAIFAFASALLVFFVLKGTGLQWVALIVLPVFFVLIMLVFVALPQANAQRLGRRIEADILVPGMMLVTLFESGNSVLSAFERVASTKSVSGKYFGKISEEFYLGKNLEEAINEAIHLSPSRSFRRVLEPIKNSLRTGTAIEKNLLATLEDLTQEKVVEIETYEKRLGPVSMFYMIFGTIVPAVGVVASIIILSVVGFTVTFFPMLFILLILIMFVQLAFLQLFKAIRPLVKL